MKTEPDVEVPPIINLQESEEAAAPAAALEPLPVNEWYDQSPEIFSLLKVNPNL